jgi:hypothetical protein
MRRMCRVFVIAVVALPVFAAAPEPGPWRINIETGVGVTQAVYSDNWAGGEAGSILWVSDFDGKAEKQLSASWFWGNELKLAFGQTHSQDKETKKWAKPVKSADKLRYDTIARLTRGWVVDPYGAGVFESQFLDASGRKKRYVNPIDLTETAGVARDLFNVPDVRVLTTRLGAGFRQRFARMDDPNDSTRTISKTTKDGGAEWVTDLTLGSAKAKYSFGSKLTVFQAIYNSEAEKLKGTPEENHWKAVDVNWDNVLRANITSILQVSLAWQLLYDKEVALGGRFKETLSLGVVYKLSRPAEAAK